MSLATASPAPPVPPANLRLIRPRPGAVQRDLAQRVLDALLQARWAGPGRYAKVENDDFTYIGDLDVDGRRQGVVLKQFAGPAGALAALDGVRPNRRAMRQWTGAQRLGAIGVPTARPLALAVGTVKGRRCDWLALDRLSGEDLLHHLARGDLGVADEHACARRVGELITTIDSLGWFNRDSKLSNLIRLPDGGIAVIDTVGIQRRPGKRVRMLSAMLAEALGHDLLPRRTILMRCLTSAVDDPHEAWRALERFAARRRNHKPRVDMLAPQRAQRQ